MSRDFLVLTKYRLKNFFDPPLARRDWVKQSDIPALSLLS